MTKETLDFSPFEEILKENSIEYRVEEGTLIASVDKRNSDGHHHLTLMLCASTSGRIIGILSGLRSNSDPMNPYEAVRKFKATVWSFSQMADC